MSAKVDLRDVSIECKHCRQSFKEPAIWLLHNPVFRCPYCDKFITAERRSGDSVEGTEPDVSGQSIADALASLDKPPDGRRGVAVRRDDTERARGPADSRRV